MKNYDKNITENGDKKGKEDDCDSDIISNYIGHYGKWQFYWTFVLCLFQLPSTFQIFAFVFQVFRLFFFFDKILIYFFLQFKKIMVNRFYFVSIIYICYQLNDEKIVF